MAPHKIESGDFHQGKKESAKRNRSLSPPKETTEDGSDPLAMLTPQLYQRLRDLSRRYMKREARGHTMHPTDVVHAALKRMRRSSDSYNDTTHFFASCAIQMRWVLVEHARKRKAKRKLSVSLEDSKSEVLDQEAESDELLLELHEALEQLATLDPDAAKACDLHYFGGHSMQEISTILSASVPTIERKIRFAKAWMRSQFENLNKEAPLAPQQHRRQP